MNKQRGSCALLGKLSVFAEAFACQILICALLSAEQRLGQADGNSSRSKPAADASENALRVIAATGARVVREQSGGAERIRVYLTGRNWAANPEKLLELRDVVNLYTVDFGLIPITDDAVANVKGLSEVDPILWTNFGQNFTTV
jgi:hypothetical protein